VVGVYGYGRHSEEYSEFEVMFDPFASHVTEWGIRNLFGRVFALKMTSHKAKSVPFFFRSFTC